MSPKTTTVAGIDGYMELSQALADDGGQLEAVAVDTIEKIDRLLAENAFDAVQFLARESVVKVPGFIDEGQSHLVVKCNERLEGLVERVRREGQAFIENAEKIRGLIDLSVVHGNRIDYETQSAWKNELVQMQGQTSAHQMDICRYYQQRSDVAANVLDQPCESDHWEQLAELDEDFFFQLRTILSDLRMFYLRLRRIVQQRLHGCGM